MGNLENKEYWLSRNKGYESGVPRYDIWVSRPILQGGGMISPDKENPIGYYSYGGPPGMLPYDVGRTIFPHIEPGLCIKIAYVEREWVKTGNEDYAKRP